VALHVRHLLSSPRIGVPSPRRIVSSSITQPGEILAGRYRKVQLLGKGGQGEVWQVLDLTSGKYLALKRNIAGGTADEKARELFERECCTLAQLQHDGIPRFYRSFEQGADLFLVLEFIEGRSLAAILAENGPFSEATLRHLAEELERVLLYLHGQQPPLIHRDIKPANVIQRPDGRYVLVDFGLVRGALGAHGALTCGGTPGYTPPEQASGQAWPQTDFYALGMTLLVLATGARPSTFFHEGLRFQLPTGLDLSPEFCLAIERLLHLDPSQRPTSWRAALAGPPAALTTKAQGPAVRPLAPVRWPLVAVSVLVAGLLATGSALRRTGPPAIDPPAPSISAATTSVSSPGSPGVQSAEAIPSSVTMVSASASASSAPPRETTCARWLREAVEGRWSPELRRELGPLASLAERIARRQLRPADLRLSKADLPCHDQEPERVMEPFAIAVRLSATAWTAAEEPSTTVLEAVRASPEGLSAASRRALAQAIAAKLAPTMASARRPEDLEPARHLCELEGRLGLPSSAVCSEVVRRQSLLAAQEEQKRERCDRARGDFEKCNVDCTFQFDLFDPRVRQCDRRCLAAHSLPGCPKLEPIPD